jgi:hypothetical protein
VPNAIRSDPPDAERYVSSGADAFGPPAGRKAWTTLLQQFVVVFR